MLIQEVIFIDIETTGFRPTLDKIIEIGFYHVKDGAIIQKWGSLINPGVTIPVSIKHLTGISSDMLSAAPYFADIAELLFTQLNGKILIAHNARFDCSFLKNEFAQLGFTLQIKTLCTVQLSRHLYPNATGHSLDALMQRFNLTTLAKQHRALADVALLYEIFQKFQTQFTSDRFAAAIKATLKSSSVPIQLNPEQLKNIPTTSGVYRFYGENDALLYIGKSNCLKTRILSHFSSVQRDNKEMRIAQQLQRLDWIQTAGELGALLLEAHLIKKQIPIFNKRLRRHKSLFALQLIATEKSYYQIQIIACTALQAMELPNIYSLYKTRREAEQSLKHITIENSLCHKLVGLDNSKHACFHYQLNKCRGACIGKDDMELYNLRVMIGLAPLKIKAWPYASTIAIREICPQRQITDYHIIDKWCYLTTIHSEHELEQRVFEPVAPLFDLDTYKILTAYLEQNANKICIIDL